MNLDTLHANLINLDPWDVLVRIIDKNLDHIERLNKEQLQRGDSAISGVSTGSHTGSEQSNLYVDDKIERGVYDESIYPSVNLYSHGSFYRGITAKIDIMSGVYIQSTDNKADMLEERYGEHLLGLNTESLSQFIDIIIDEFRQNILNEIQKG